MEYSLQWTRWERYEPDPTAPEWLRPVGAPRGVYQPTAERGLVAALSRVGQAHDVEAAVERLGVFMADYGHLGQTELCAPPWRPSLDEAGRRVLVVGDQMAWALEHAAHVAAILLLAKSLQTRGTRTLERVVSRVATAQREDPSAATTSALRIPSVTFPFSPTRVLPEAVTDDTHPQVVLDIAAVQRAGLVRAGRALLAAWLTPGLLGVERTPTGFRFRSLIQLIYWQLADAVLGPTPRALQRCAACGGFFFKTDNRQRHCPPPTDGPRESRCAKRERMRRLRRGSPRTPVNGLNTR